MILIFLFYYNIHFSITYYYLLFIIIIVIIDYY